MTTKENEDIKKRSIRSFVLRQGRLTTAQERALETEMPKYGIAYGPRQLDLNAVFGRAESRKIVEIGFGMGETTAHIAEQHPEWDTLGIEVHTPGVGSLLKQVSERGLTNVRVIQHDAVEVLKHMIADGSLDGVHIFFPDPWHKKRHHKRRLIQPEFVKLLSSKLKPGGYLHAATDWQEYAEWILEILKTEPLLENSAADYAPKPDYRPLTKFEKRGLRLGHGVWDIL
ncbi:MAG TPA: tRNA (guanosine(46)-N7)-methyltransferase TrmB, partial [Methylophilaceae bacterium]|nr:tRNA (guanosine(46)-N7)-methyltransferase TrmB [Methylophilaceae bacterium]